MEFDNLQGLAILNALNNVISLLLEDYNDVHTINDITFNRIYAEIEYANLMFDEHGNIV